MKTTENLTEYASLSVYTCPSKTIFWRCIMRTGQWKTMGIGSLIGKMIYAVFGLAASMLCIMGYYPVVPAFYTACCLDKKRNFLLYIGLVVGMGWCMPVAAIVKYLFILCLPDF